MTFEETVEASGDSRAIDADQVQMATHQVHEHLPVEMRQSQDIMEEGGNWKRLPATQILKGTKVWLDARHIQTTRPSRKMDWKRLVPYTVKRMVSHYAYELE